SQLLSLTFPTRIRTNATLMELFQITQAPYKLWIKDACTVFSPEAFVRINQDTISTFPMKGTNAQAAYKNREVLLEDARENAEHATVVDVLRNDLTKIADGVELVKYRYVDQVNTAKGQLLQTSSVIQGQIKEELKRNFGTILASIFPPGSVTGSPKDKTTRIIRRIEVQPRGYYTGIMGYFDGLQLDSAVLIRYVEQTPDGYFFRSGGGITRQSDWLAEYHEMLAKCELPLAREHRHLLHAVMA
ncbi:MAG: aminodeoxychorismate synthase component I, partial [Saprospiraceae bacterium]|nr:aminodeoxychorismate synthase component I [Saprospiraceae bacterium]